jgi:hypothetical protein
MPALHPVTALSAYRIRIQLETYLGRRGLRSEEFLAVRKKYAKRASAEIRRWRGN